MTHPAAPPAPTLLVQDNQTAPGLQSRPDTQAELDARLASTPLGLPAVLDALTKRGCLSPAERRRHLNRFRMDRGPHDVRERRVLARLAHEVGEQALAAAALSAARVKLGLPEREAAA